MYFSYTGVGLGSTPDETPFPIRAYRTARYKYIRNLNHQVGHPKLGGIRLPPEELYDLKADPGERINLAEQPRHQSLKQELSQRMGLWMARTDDRGIESELESLRRYPIER